ncbi:MAG: MATE family efflux transporter [Candidatus Woesearchaeota archaeon]
MTRNRIDEFINNPKKSLFKLAWPMLIGMLVQTLYNIVDTAFVGRLGAESIAALTFSFPIFFIFIAINSGIAIGMSSRIARYLGGKNKEQAENTAMHGLIISVLLSVIAVILGVAFLDPIFSLFGAEGVVLVLAKEYMSIVLYGMLFMFLSFLINSIFSAQGDTITPMKVQVFALVLNIILDPIFIYVLGYGVKGAAIATTISFILGFIGFVYYLHKKSYLTIHPSSFTFSTRIIKEIFSIGIPGSMMMLLMSLYLMFINKFMAHFGIDYVAAFGITFRLESVAIMPIVAFSTAILTLVGMFHGAKRNDLLKEIIWYGIRINVLFTAAIGALFFIFPKLFLMLFTTDAALLQLGSAYLRIQVLYFPLIAITMMIARSMQGMGYGMPGLIVNLVRVIFVAIPLSYVFIFVLGYGYLSVVTAMVLGSLVSAVIGIVWLVYELKKEKVV